MFRVFIFLSVIAVILPGCLPVDNISNENFSSEYRDDEKNFHPQFSVFHFSPDSSRLFIQLNTNELLYTKQLEDTFRASFQVYLRIIESYESPVVRDTVRRLFHINKTLEGAGKRIFTADYRLPPPGQYLIECNIYDVNKKITETEYINLENNSPQCNQNFFFHRPGSPLPFFGDYFSSKDTFSIDYHMESPPSITVKYYRREFDLPAPPYSFNVRSQFNYNADSIFTLMAGDDYKYALRSEGIYHLQLDTTNHEGATVYLFSSGFPSVTTPDALLHPIRYITSRKEYEELNSSPNRKQAVDRFWLDAGGNQERSRELVKKYYSRVEKANRRFTSFMEGWRTDRGMIYIIFGNPHSVYKSSTSESWTYGEANSSLSVTFNFTRVTNPFTDNDFILERAPIYETTWYRAVDTWRQGRVFNDF